MVAEDIKFAQDALALALKAGAQKARVTYSRSVEDLVATLNGKIDRVTHTCDNTMSFALFVDGRFGSFSTNKLTTESLEDFLAKAVNIARSLTVDEYRDLPDPDRCCKDAKTGDELGLVDASWEDIKPEDRLQAALEAAIYEQVVNGGIDLNERCREDGGIDLKDAAAGWQIIAEEGEYSDSLSESIIVDSNGLCCAHRETCFDYCVETTIECDGEKYSSYAWDSSSFRKGLKAQNCGWKALQRAVAQIGSDTIEGGSYNMVVASEVASKLVSPILRALNAYAIQQKNSFLVDSLEQQLFPESLSIVDRPHIQGQTCSKLFDSEGVATKDAAIIEKGRVKQWFVNTYMAAKMAISPSIEDATRPCMLPFPSEGLDASAIMKMCGRGIYVTGFNGGNCNGVTGDFSYGVEGFLFEDGRLVKSLSGMLITGNYLELYKDLIAVGSDARSCMSKLIPTLAFRNVEFSGI